MRIPLSWLREFTPTPADMDPAELGAVLSDLGLVVDGIERVGGGLGDVVVARVLDISAIEGADRIRKVTVDAGDRELGIVCGAWNFEVDDLVPLAPVGAVLPGGFEIGRRKMRGVVSEGMLCSGRELGLSDDAAGLLVLGSVAGPAGATVLPLPGTPIAAALGIVADVVFDLDIAPNRPDCLSVVGVARDLAARLRLPFRLPEPEAGESGEPASASASVAVIAPELCTRLTGRVLRGVSVVDSPAEVTRRLVLCGMRPINAVVDASNYVMLELGQPTHPYDLDLLGGHGLVARAGHAGEELTTLDGTTREVGPSDCVIADAEDRAVGIAGIMGGGETEISAGTTTVLLEAAHFVPLTIARTARRLGLRSEASVRFERGCDPEIAELAGLRFCELVSAAMVAAGGEAPSTAPGLLDARPVAPQRTRITLRTARVNALLGTDLADDEIRAYLEPIGFVVEPSGGGIAEVEVPSYRPDVTREADVVEEVARHHGYSRIPRRHRRAPGVGALTAHQRRRRELRRSLSAAGAHEAWTPSFVSPADHERAGMAGGEVRLANPLASEESVLRRSLVPGLLHAVARNVAHRHPDLRVFEVGHVFTPPPAGVELPGEAEVFGLVLARAGDGAESAVRAWRHIADLLGIEGVRMSAGAGAPPGLHPTRSARLAGPDGVELGTVGEVDPEVIAAFGLPHERIGWVGAATAPLLALAGAARTVREPGRFPSSDVDLAFAVEDSVPAAAVEETLARAAGEICESVRLFDVYRGPGVDPGWRSLAYRLRLCAADRTLTESEISGVRQACVNEVERTLPARLRT